jgi:hypothetical protein
MPESNLTQMRSGDLISALIILASVLLLEDASFMIVLSFQNKPGVDGDPNISMKGISRSSNMLGFSETQPGYHPDR